VSDDRFYSVDRLVEYGMSMSVAQQMVQTMNNAMENMNTQNIQSPLHSTPAASYYIMIENNPAGPFTEQQVSDLVRDLKIDKKPFVWKTGLRGWVMAEQMPEILKWITLTPPSFQQGSTSS